MWILDSYISWLHLTNLPHYSPATLQHHITTPHTARKITISQFRVTNTNEMFCSCIFVNTVLLIVIVIDCYCLLPICLVNAINECPAVMICTAMKNLWWIELKWCAFLSNAGIPCFSGQVWLEHRIRRSLLSVTGEHHYV